MYDVLTMYFCLTKELFRNQVIAPWFNLSSTPKKQIAFNLPRKIADNLAPLPTERKITGYLFSAIIYIHQSLLRETSLGILHSTTKA